MNVFKKISFSTWGIGICGDDCDPRDDGGASRSRYDWGSGRVHGEDEADKDLVSEGRKVSKPFGLPNQGQECYMNSCVQIIRRMYEGMTTKEKEVFKSHFILKDLSSLFARPGLKNKVYEVICDEIKTITRKDYTRGRPDDSSQLFADLMRVVDIEATTCWCFQDLIRRCKSPKGMTVVLKEKHRMNYLTFPSSTFRSIQQGVDHFENALGHYDGYGTTFSVFPRFVVLCLEVERRKKEKGFKIEPEVTFSTDFGDFTYEVIGMTVHGNNHYSALTKNGDSEYWKIDDSKVTAIKGFESEIKNYSRTNLVLLELTRANPRIFPHICYVGMVDGMRPQLLRPNLLPSKTKSESQNDNDEKKAWSEVKKFTGGENVSSEDIDGAYIEMVEHVWLRSWLGKKYARVKTIRKCDVCFTYNELVLHQDDEQADESDCSLGEEEGEGEDYLSEEDEEEPAKKKKNKKVPLRKKRKKLSLDEKAIKVVEEMNDLGQCKFVRCVQCSKAFCWVCGKSRKGCEAKFRVQSDCARESRKRSR